MKKKTAGKAISRRPFMTIEGNRVALKGYKIKDVELVPQWEIKTTEETVPIYDNEGNSIGVSSRFVKESTIRFFPDIKKEDKEIKKEGD